MLDPGETPLVALSAFRLDLPEGVCGPLRPFSCPGGPFKGPVSSPSAPAARLGKLRTNSAPFPTISP